MARTQRFQFPGDDHGTATTNENAARRNRLQKHYRKGEPKTPRISLGRLRQEIRASEGWPVIR